MRRQPAPKRPPDCQVAASTFRVGRRRILATGAEALGRWAVQQGILPRAEGGTQRPPAERLAGLMADPACALPLAGLDPAALVALRRRRLAALGSVDAMLVEQAALAAAITLLCELHGLPWPHPMQAEAADGTWLIAPETLRAARRRGDGIALALACGARFAEVERMTLDCATGGGAWLLLPGRALQVPAGLAPCQEPLEPGRGVVALARSLDLTEPTVRLSGLADRLCRGSHLDEAFVMAGVGSDPPMAPIRIPWLGEVPG